MDSRRTRALIVLAVLAALLLACVLVGWRDTTSPFVATVEIAVPGLADEVRLLHVSDLQGERYGSGQERLARLLDGKGYDAVVLTGDMVSEDGGDRTELWEALPILARTSDTIVFVPGNHDDPGVGPDLARRGVIDLGTVGVFMMPTRDVPGAGRPDATGAVTFSTLDAASRAAASSSGPLVVVDHVPPSDAIASDLAGLGADLYLAGHFHGGQLRLPLLGAVIVPWSHETDWQWFPEPRGMHVRGLRVRGGLAVHLSPGLARQAVFGVKIPRTFNRAEMTELVLVPAE